MFFLLRKPKIIDFTCLAFFIDRTLVRYNSLVISFIVDHLKLITVAFIHSSVL